MTPNRVYKKLCKSPHTRNASQGIPDGGDFCFFSFLFRSYFRLPSRFFICFNFHPIMNLLLYLVLLFIFWGARTQSEY